MATRYHRKCTHQIVDNHRTSGTKPKDFSKQRGNYSYLLFNLFITDVRSYELTGHGRKLSSIEETNKSLKLINRKCIIRGFFVACATAVAIHQASCVTIHNSNRSACHEMVIAPNSCVPCLWTNFADLRRRTCPSYKTDNHPCRSFISLWRVKCAASIYIPCASFRVPYNRNLSGTFTALSSGKVCRR